MRGNSSNVGMDRWLTLREWYQKFGYPKHSLGIYSFFENTLGFSKGTVSGWLNRSKTIFPTSQSRRKLVERIRAQGHDLEKEGLGWLLAGDGQVKAWISQLEQAPKSPKPKKKILGVIPILGRKPKVDLREVLTAIDNVCQRIEQTLQAAERIIGKGLLDTLAVTHELRRISADLADLAEQLHALDVRGLPTDQAEEAIALTNHLMQTVEVLLKPDATELRERYRDAVSAQELQALRQELFVLSQGEAAYRDYSDMQRT